MAKAIKTNVLRHLDALKIPYETREYTVEDEQFDGLLTARKLGMDPAMVFKTLVLTGDKLPHLVCCLGVTGYVRGGCSPIGMKKAFPTFVDASARNQEKISVSAGVRGCQVLLATDQLLACVHGTLAELTQAAGE